MRSALLLLVALLVPGAGAAFALSPFIEDEGHWEAWRFSLPAGGEAILRESYVVDDRPSGRMVAFHDGDWRFSRWIYGAGASDSQWIARVSTGEVVVEVPKDETYSGGVLRLRWIVCEEACEIGLMVAHAGLPESKISLSAPQGLVLGHANGTSAAALAADDFEGTFVAGADHRLVAEAHLDVVPQRHMLGRFTGDGTSMSLDGEAHACDCQFEGSQPRRFAIEGPQLDPAAVLFYADYEQP